MKQIRILLVEDEAIVAMQIRSEVQKMGHIVIATFASGEETIAALESVASTDMILMDIKLQGAMDGIEAARIINHHFDIPIIFLTANSELPTIERASEATPYGYLLKPVGSQELAICIQISMYKFEQDRKVKAIESRLSALLASTDDAVIATDSGGGITFINPRAEEFTDWKQQDALNKPLGEVLSVESVDGEKLRFEPSPILDNTFGTPQSFDKCIVISQKGKQIPIDGSRRPIRNDLDEIKGFVITFRDVTERNSQDKLMLQLEKSESLTRMASAIAHNYNNLLAGVIGNLDLIKIKLDEGQDPRNNVMTAIRISETAAQMSKQMLTYVGQSFSDRTSFDLDLVCRNILTNFRQKLPETVAFIHESIAPSPMILCNEQQIRLLISGILTNASESLTSQCGTITQRVYVCDYNDISPTYRFPPEWKAQAQHYACIEIQDTGCGIASDRLDKIFEPFFSDKFTGRGMGLSVALGIIREYQGVITVESVVDFGSTFRVYLPLT